MLLPFYIFTFTQMLSAIPPPVPSAGVVEREIEKEYEGEPLLPDKEIPAIQIEIPDEKLDLPEGEEIYVEDIEIIGNDSISSDEIKSWVECYLGNKMSLKAIYKLCNVIDKEYAKRGYFLARAYPPPQSIYNFTLTIEVIEGKLGNIKVVGNKYYKESFIISYFNALKGKTLQYDRFVRALVLLNDNRKLVAGAVFEKGKKFGYADVILQIDDAFPTNIYFNGNNYGKNLTTNTRAGTRIDWGNLFFQGDTLSVTEVVGFPVDALYFTDVNYTFLLNRRGTSLTGSYLFSKFRIHELKILRLKGRSYIATLKLNQAVTRTRSFSSDLFAYFDYKQIQNIALGERVSFDKLRVLTLGALFDHFSPSMGRDYLVLRFAAGIPRILGGLKAVDIESSRLGGGGRFFILTADYDRIQLLPKDCYLYLHGTGQYSPSKLTQPEQIYIGGSNTVRGFPLATALGDSGYYCNIEFRIPPPLANKRFFGFKKKWKELVQIDFFLDHGGVFFNEGKDAFLWGSGGGIRIRGPYNFVFSLDVGLPINHRDDHRGAFIYGKLTCQAF
jgi:hemolysin activation/secretion protein